MTGIPVTYNMSNDNLMLSLLIVYLLSMAYVTLKDGNNIAEHIKSMFYYGSKTAPYVTRTHKSKTGSFMLYAQFIFSLCVITFEILRHSHDALFSKGSLLPLVTFTLFFTAAIAIKILIYEFVNRVLYTSKQTKEWRQSYFFTIQITGAILTPLTIASILWESMPPQITRIYLVFACVIYLVMLSLRYINIIFNEKYNILDIFLYLCAIELFPSAIIWKTIPILSNFIIIKI